MFYFLSIAQVSSNASKYIQRGQEKAIRKYRFEDRDDNNDNEGDNESDHDSSSDYKNKSKPKRKKPKTESNTKKAGDPSDSELIWSGQHIHQMIGAGRSGRVYLADVKGRNVALKMADQEHQQNLQRELDIYNRLILLQGICIPKIILHSVISPSGMMTGFAMELLDPLPSSFEEWSTGQLLSAKTALMRLAIDGKVKQMDIRPDNFGHKGDVVFAFDFEEIEFISNKKQIKIYDQMLIRLFKING
jgi:hypothetical protein